MGASIDWLRGLRARRFNIQTAIPVNSIKRATSPVPIPIADPVVSRELESAPPNGAALSMVTHLSLEHILSYAQSLFVEHVAMTGVLV